MPRSFAVAVIVALASSATVASAIESPQYCCACLQDGAAGPGGTTNGTTSTALFCLASNNGTVVEAASVRCDDLTGNNLLCVADGASCHDDLAEIGVKCPATGAPTAGAASLLTLALVLGACGMLAVRRGRRRGAIPVEH